ncbi:MAG: protein phosphatase 2C domain-containing protein [Gemmataceae bacterium]
MPFRTQKSGNQDSEYEDAYWPETCFDQVSASSRFAVADGATESCFSGRWARALVKAAGEGTISLCPADGLDRLRKEWQEWVQSQPLPWYLEEKAEQGAFAALVVLTIMEDDKCREQGRWEAVAIGDSCIVQMRGNQLLAAFPLTRSSDFDNRPYLLGSRGVREEDLGEHLQRQSGTWQIHDSFLLMTDALACWFLRETEENRRPWELIRGLSGLNGTCSFQEWIDRLRACNSIRNDDCTLLVVTIA